MLKKTSFTALLAVLALVTASHADTLKLRSGKIVQGTFLGADSRQLTFLESNGTPMTFVLTDVQSVIFAAIPAPAVPSAAPAVAPAPPPMPQPENATLLAGALIPVRLVNTLDTSTTQTGNRFTATLNSNLMAGDVVVARKGAAVHGIVTKSENARRLTGKSELQLELTNIVINGAARPISTSGFQQKGASSGASTAKTTAGGAGLGAAIGAIGGNAGKGAAIGAVSGLGLSAVKKGQPIRLPAETLLEFSLSQPTILPVQH